MSQPTAKYRHEFVVEDMEISIVSYPRDPRHQYEVDRSKASVQLHVCDEDLNYNDDSQEATVDFYRREQLVELIESLKLACNEAFDLYADREVDGPVQMRLGVVAEMDAQRDRELARHVEAVAIYQGKLREAIDRLETVETVANRLYDATQYAIHNTTDETIRSGLVNQIADYDYARRNLQDFTFADPMDNEKEDNR